MFSLFVSNLSEEYEVFRFAHSYAQSTVKLYITPFIAFIFDKLTFFGAIPWPASESEEEYDIHVIAHRWSAFIAQINPLFPKEP